MCVCVCACERMCAVPMHKSACMRLLMCVHNVYMNGCVRLRLFLFECVDAGAGVCVCTCVHVCV